VAGFVDTTVAEIDSRLEELKAEVGKLEAARSALTGGGGSRRGTSASSASAGSRRGARRQTRARGRRSSTRGDQALELVRQKPGITIPEIAQSLGIEPNYLYRVMPNLVKSGQVKRDGQGWHPAEG
jgi:hypothetical protein